MSPSTCARGPGAVAGKAGPNSREKGHLVLTARASIVYMAAVLEYLVAEIVELAGNAARWARL